MCLLLTFSSVLFFPGLHPTSRCLQDPTHKDFHDKGVCMSHLSPGTTSCACLDFLEEPPVRFLASPHRNAASASCVLALFARQVKQQTIPDLPLLGQHNEKRCNPIGNSAALVENCSVQQACTNSSCLHICSTALFIWCQMKGSSIRRTASQL